MNTHRNGFYKFFVQVLFRESLFDTLGLDYFIENSEDYLRDYTVHERADLKKKCELISKIISKIEGEKNERTN